MHRAPSGRQVAAGTALAVLTATGGLAVTAPASAAPAGSKGAAVSEQAVSQGFRKAVTVAGISEHLAAFQAAADAHGGNRLAASPGYEASAEYVIERMEAAGYTVTSQYFPFTYNGDESAPVLRADTPAPSTTYVDGVQFRSMTFSEDVGPVTAPVYAVDLELEPAGFADGASNTSGCQAADFAGFPAGAIALTQRGGCGFAAKTANAKAAGAAATIIMNEGNKPSLDRQGLLNATLVAVGNGGGVGTTFPTGMELARGTANGLTGGTATVKVDRFVGTRTTRNLIAETSGGDPDRVIAVGAHLDSVSRGAGINDNGSGSATILEVAEVLASQQREVRNKVRFLWFGAEELGLLGSEHYVEALSAEEQGRIALNLNFDMVASPNYVRFVYDGDNSAYPVGPGAAEGPEGSGEIERVFTDYFAAATLPSAETPFSGRSDYGPFIAVGIPAGGLFTGAEQLKTAAEAAVFGGTAGEAFDRCYHLACDTMSNINATGLDEMSDAVAHSVLHFSRRDFGKQPLMDPATPVEGSFKGGEGGGLHEDHDHDHDEQA